MAAGEALAADRQKLPHITRNAKSGRGSIRGAPPQVRQCQRGPFVINHSLRELCEVVATDDLRGNIAKLNIRVDTLALCEAAAWDASVRLLSCRSQMLADHRKAKLARRRALLQGVRAERSVVAICDHGNPFPPVRQRKLRDGSVRSVPALWTPQDVASQTVQFEQVPSTVWSQGHLVRRP